MIRILLFLTVANIASPATDTNDKIKFATPNTVVAADVI